MTTQLYRHIKHAEIIFRNFSGKGSKYNPEGMRSFSVVLDRQTAEEMVSEGWHIKTMKLQDTEQTFSFVTVAISSDATGLPHIRVDGTYRVDISTLDAMHIHDANVELTGVFWEVLGQSGHKAYMKSLTITT